MDNKDIDEPENLFEKAVNSTINNYYVYGVIIILIMVVIYFTFSIHNLNNVESKMNTIESNYLKNNAIVDNINNNNATRLNKFINSIFQQKNLQILILVSYFVLTMIFLFLYNRAKDKNKGGYGYLNLFTSNKEKINSDMLNPMVNLIYKIGYVSGGISLIIVIIIFVLWIYNSFSKLHVFLNLLLSILTLFILLTLIYLIFKKQIDDLARPFTQLNPIQKIIKIIVQFIFLIPCLILIFIDVIKYQIKITTPTLWIILFIEIIIICLYFFIPLLFKKLNSHDGKMLLEGPVFINKRRRIGTYQNVEKNDIFRKKIEEKIHFSLFKNTADNNTFDPSNNEFINEEAPPFNITIDLETNNAPVKNSNYYNNMGIQGSGHQRYNFNYNYAVSLFIYINRQPVNTSRAYMVDTTIFDYASKPKIVYNELDQQLKFICTDVNNLEKTIYATNDIKYQKWIHIVVNYRSGVVDIFIDGTLRASEYNIQPYMDYSKIYVGSNEGIAGGIKNVMYFNKPLSLDKIKYINNFM